jgi:murein DD-endopeptidase MepM/ murein hydrolase activator NlpD
MSDEIALLEQSLRCPFPKSGGARTFYIVLIASLFFVIQLFSLSTTTPAQNGDGSRNRIEIARPESTVASPIQGLKDSELHDSFYEIHNGHRHEAIDISEPAGTPVHAVVDGRVQKLFLSKAGGNTIYEFDRGSVYCYYYAHLDRYVGGLHDGMPVSQGEVIGYVGSTGNASRAGPHLHFAIYLLGPQKHWWRGTPIDPFPVLEHSVRQLPRLQKRGRPD